MSQGIRYKTTAEEEDSGFELKTSADGAAAGKPLIQEIGTKEASKIAEERKAREQARLLEEQEKPFDWETAERGDLKGQFIQQGENVFMNIPAKGYNKEEDVRYALSSDEFIIELREKTPGRGKNQHQIRRLCQTLSKSVDVGRSDIQLLVDFIVVRL